MNLWSFFQCSLALAYNRKNTHVTSPEGILPQFTKIIQPYLLY